MTVTEFDNVWEFHIHLFLERGTKIHTSFSFPLCMYSEHAGVPHEKSGVALSADIYYSQWQSAIMWTMSL